MKKLLFTILFSLFLSAGISNAHAEKLQLSCKYENKSWGTVTEYEFDLKNKKYITALGEKVDMAYTEDEIVFQSYIVGVMMFSFQVNRKNGQGSIAQYDYEPILKDAKEGKLMIQMAHSHLRYPDLSDEDKTTFSIRDYVGKTFTPTSKSKLDCSKLEKKF
jgi:hypothetical protein